MKWCSKPLFDAYSDCDKLLQLSNKEYLEELIKEILHAIEYMIKINQKSSEKSTYKTAKKVMIASLLAHLKPTPNAQHPQSVEQSTESPRASSPRSWSRLISATSPDWSAAMTSSGQ
jgi:hypothetical protein